jgi:Aminoglycoside-2''-adenylyltransferase
MTETAPTPVLGDPTTTFYVEALSLLDRAGIPYLVGGAFALACHAKIERETKDLDVFLRAVDLPAALAAFERHGYRTELPFPHWLGKVYCEEQFIDIIFSSGNGIARVDDRWFEHAVGAEIFGRRMKLCPAEEMIWSKAFVQERERYDGADVLHLLRGLAATLDWSRLLWRFGPHWRVLFSFIILFGFVYPDQQEQIPAWVSEELLRRLSIDRSDAEDNVCYGTLLSREQYLIDIERFGYRDGRIEPDGQMTRAETEIWTKAIPEKK